MKALYGVLLLFLSVNIGILYYMVFFSDFPDFEKRLSLAEQRINTSLATKDGALLPNVATDSGSLVVLTQQQENKITTEVARTIRRELAEEALDAKEKEAAASPTPTPTTANGSSTIHYIPLGGAYSDNANNNWDDTWLEFSFNLGDYQSIKAITFEAGLRHDTGVGQVKARLYDVASGAVGNSEVTASGSDGSYVKSNNISIGSGNRTIRVQLYTTETTRAHIENARLRVDTGK